MARFFNLSRIPRFQIAVVVALAGWAVSMVMVYWGGSLSRHLPDQGFHVAASVGAFSAGWIVADGLGQSGRRGWILSALWFLGATALGAGLGATLGMAVVLPWSSGFDMPELGEFLAGLPMLVGFGWLAVLDGVATSLAVAGTWGAMVVLVHTAAGYVRTRHAMLQSVEPF